MGRRRQRIADTVPRKSNRADVGKCRAEVGNHLAEILGDGLESRELCGSVETVKYCGDWIKEGLKHPSLENYWEFRQAFRG